MVLQQIRKLGDDVRCPTARLLPFQVGVGFDHVCQLVRQIVLKEAEEKLMMSVTITNT